MVKLKSLNADSSELELQKLEECLKNVPLLIGCFINLTSDAEPQFRRRYIMGVKIKRLYAGFIQIFDLISMRKILSVISILLITILPSRAQNILKGVIVDESNTTIPAVTVRILNTDSTFIAGSVTDDHGLFLFENVEAGNYILAISSIGYTSLFLNMEMPQTSYDLPTIEIGRAHV